MFYMLNNGPAPKHGHYRAGSEDTVSWINLSDFRDDAKERRYADEVFWSASRQHGCAERTCRQCGRPSTIGMITTLSGAGGYLGEETRDGFQLAIDQDGGKLGGVAVKLMVEDDGLSPPAAKKSLSALSSEIT